MTKTILEKDLFFIGEKLFYFFTNFDNLIVIFNWIGCSILMAYYFGDLQKTDMDLLFALAVFILFIPPIVNSLFKKNEKE